MGRKKGERNKTHKRIVSHGYIHLFEPTHPMAMKNGYVREHRKILYDTGVVFNKTDEIHHLNGDKQDNHLENLQVMTKAEHASKTWKGKKRREWTDEERQNKSKQMKSNQNWKGKNPELLNK